MLKAFFRYSLISGLVLVSACGAHKRGSVEDNVDFTSKIITGGSPLPEDQMAVALRICYAFRSKRSNFRTEYMGNSFRFKTTRTSCNEPGQRVEYLNTTLRQNLESDPMTFDTTTDLKYFKKVKTHQDGILSNICDQVIKGETPVNVFDHKNGVAEVTFYENLGVDNFSVRYGSKSSALQVDFDPVKIENFKVLTSSASSGNLIGLVYESDRYEPCSGSSESSYFKQSYEEQ